MAVLLVICPNHDVIPLQKRDLIRAYRSIQILLLDALQTRNLQQNLNELCNDFTLDFGTSFLTILSQIYLTIHLHWPHSVPSNVGKRLLQTCSYYQELLVMIMMSSC